MSCITICLCAILLYPLLHLQDIFSKVDKSGEGVCVQASTLGSLEALLTFLDSDDVGIPVSGGWPGQGCIHGMFGRIYMLVRSPVAPSS